tara:strand:- start:1237 stop:1581 length:345 start_codon:yes stop_codon:yes gene_type:complete
MIDTDKYTGHTPGRWRVEGELTEGDDGWGQSGDSTLSIHGDNLYIGEIGADYGIHETRANAQLIADAPLLLEEVKRLRKENNRYLDFILWLGIEHKGKKLAWEYGDEELAEMIE